MRSLATLLLALTAALVRAEASSLYPAPRQVASGAELSAACRPTEVVFVADETDAPTLAVLRTVLSKAPAGVQMRVGWRGQPGMDAVLRDVPAVSGAYRLKVAADGILIAGHDARGAYYGARTLAALLASGLARETTVTDWPEVAHRGVVEGFYGTPWSHERRLSLIRFMGEVKLNTYIYGPKDDPFHSSPNWRKPYPAAEGARIHELVEASRASHVDFVWAVHPGKDIRWNDADFAAVLAKFESMYALGVRGFSVFFDDISGEGTKADQQARLLNFLNERFVKAKGDVLPLVLCPTQYNRAWSGGDYLDVLGRNLDPSIQVMWTGNSVVADQHREGMEWINGRLRRKAYVWWNFPVSDFVRNHLLLGPAYGNDTDIGPLLGGFVSNPMERSEASKVALFGVANYSWNPAAHDAAAAWRAGIRQVIPGASAAYETFAAHNCDLGKNFHGYRREESAELAPAAEALLGSLRAGKPADVSAVRAELARIAAAPAAIRAGADNPLLLEEIGPWLDAFEQIGRAGVAALDALAALDRRETGPAWRSLAAAHAALARADEIDRTENRNPYQPGIVTGSKVVTPLVRELVEAAGVRLVVALGGRPALRPRPIASFDGIENPERMLDGDETTYAYAKRIQVAGDWIGVDLGGPRKVHRIRIAQGRNDGDHDLVHDGVLEGLGGDGQWREIRRVKAARVDVVLELAVTFTQVRIRVLKPGVPGGKPDLWTAIREFEIDPVNAAEFRSSVAALRGASVRLADGVYTVSPGYEVHALPPGGQLGLLLPAPAEVRGVEIDLGAPMSDCVLEGSADGESWKPLTAKVEGGRLRSKASASLRGVRVRNAAAGTMSVTLKAFVLKTAPRPADPADLASDGLPATFATLSEQPLQVAVPGGTRRVALLLSGDLAGLRVGARRGASETALVVRDPMDVDLPEGTEALVVRTPAGSKAILHEVIAR